MGWYAMSVAAEFLKQRRDTVPSALCCATDVHWMCLSRHGSSESAADTGQTS